MGHGKGMVRVFAVPLADAADVLESVQAVAGPRRSASSVASLLEGDLAIRWQNSSGYCYWTSF